MNKINWLNHEVENWVKRGIVSSEQAKKISAQYLRSTPDKHRIRTLFLMFGTVCLGFGAILLFAYNWNELDRIQRTCIAFLPMLISVALSVRTFTKHHESLSWRESVSAFFFLAIGATLIILSQAYHLANDIGALILIWMLLALPLVYFFDTGISLLFYLVGITAWAAQAQNAQGDVILYWPLFLLVFPKVRSVFQDYEGGASKIWVGWVICITLTVALGISLEKSLPGLWIVIYAFYFSMLEWVGRRFFSNVEFSWQNPMRHCGRVGLIALSYLLTFSWAWQNVGWNYYRSGSHFHNLAAIGDYVLLAFFGFWALRGWVEAFTRRDTSTIPLGFLSFLAAVCYVFQNFKYRIISPEIVFNSVLFMTGLFYVLTGWKESSPRKVNGGMFTLVLIIVTRFSDTSWSVLIRSVIFMTLGFSFLLINHLMSRKLAAVNIDKL